MKRIIPIIMVFAMLASALTGCELIGGITNIPEATHEHNELVTSEPVAEATETVREVLTAAGLDAATLEPITPSLEDVFVALIEERDRSEVAARGDKA